MVMNSGAAQIHLVQWEDIGRPVENGGQGLKNMYLFCVGKKPLDAAEWKQAVATSHEGKIFSKNYYDPMGYRILETGHIHM